MPKLFLNNSGLIPSPDDNRDLLTSKIIPPIKRYPKECPAPFDLTHFDQDGTPRCVGYSGAPIKEYLEKRERNNVVFDGDWLYKKCKEIDGHPELKGTYLRALMKVLQKFGAKPLNGTEAEAEKYKISAYARVDDLSFESIKKHIFVYGIVLAGFTGSNEGWRTAYVRPPKAGEKIWNHATDLKAYLEKYHIGQNSWGEKWGDKGDFYVPKGYQPFEAWVVLVDYPTGEVSQPSYGWVALPYLNLAQIGNKGVVIAPTLNLRSNPNGSIIGKLSRGDKIEIIGKPQPAGNYTWVKIRKPEATSVNLTGWWNQGWKYYNS